MPLLLTCLVLEIASGVHTSTAARSLLTHPPPPPPTIARPMATALSKPLGSTSGTSNTQTPFRRGKERAPTYTAVEGGEQEEEEGGAGAGEEWPQTKAISPTRTSFGAAGQEPLPRPCPRVPPASSRRATTVAYGPPRTGGSTPTPWRGERRLLPSATRLARGRAGSLPVPPPPRRSEEVTGNPAATTTPTSAAAAAAAIFRGRHRCTVSGEATKEKGSWAPTCGGKEGGAGRRQEMPSQAGTAAGPGTCGGPQRGSRPKRRQRSGGGSPQTWRTRHAASSPLAVVAVAPPEAASFRLFSRRISKGSPIDLSRAFRRERREHRGQPAGACAVPWVADQMPAAARLGEEEGQEQEEGFRRTRRCWEGSTTVGAGRRRRRLSFSSTRRWGT